MKIEITADGSNSLRHNLLGELYHSDRGAIGESLHVFIDAGFCYVAAGEHSKIAVFEVGFGSGLNAWLTLDRAAKMGIEVDYHCVELYPIDIETASQLNFTKDKAFMDLHHATWNEMTVISSGFSITKHLCDWQTFEFQSEFDLLYYDAFAPEIQPELWSQQCFDKVYNAMRAGGVITTYTAKGVVKRALREAGFTVQRLTGALGKRHMLRAIR